MTTSPGVGWRQLARACRSTASPGGLLTYTARLTNAGPDTAVSPGETVTITILVRVDVGRMLQEIPDCKFAVVPGSGHSIPLESPKGFLEAVKTFLQEAPGLVRSLDFIRWADASRRRYPAQSYA